MKKIPFPVIVITALLLVYSVLTSLQDPLRISNYIFFASPFLIVWMVISVLKDKTYQSRELAGDEEWGYADRKKEDLGTF